MDKAKLKNIVFSFDDGRKDTYSIAYEIMKKYNLVGTVHVITGSLDNTYSPSKGFASGERKFISIADLKEMKKNGFEISSHSENHTNEYDMIEKSLKKLINIKLMEKEALSFSSPRSEINQYNYKKYGIDKLNLKYLRTGIQIRNEKFLKKVAFVFQKYFKSKVMFYYLNKENIINLEEDNFFIKTVAIRKYNSFNQIKYMINKVKKGQTMVLLFHSINPEKDIPDDWGYYFKDFEKICQFVANEKEINNDTIINLIDFNCE